jgi:hypothetical protein
LPVATTAAQDEVLDSIESQGLRGIGLGYVDVHLLTSARLTNVSLWTEDKNPRPAAAGLERAFQRDS